MEENALVVRSEKSAKLLFATNPQGMADAQSHLAEWFCGKIAEIRQEMNEVQKALKVAQKNKWAVTTLRNQVSRIKGRLIFYGKALSAVKAGYYLIPDFPIEVFAVRTKKEKPLEKWHSSNSEWESGAYSQINPERLLKGEGKWVAGQADRWESSSSLQKYKDEQGKECTRHWFKNYSFKDFQMPVVAMKAEIMDATAKAMALKIFDEIGICPPRKRDPMIIGRIHGPKVGYTEKTFSFLICWFLEPDRL